MTDAASAADRVVATVRSYADLVAGLRLWMNELGTTGEAIDAIAGLPDRYTGKLIAPVPMRNIGKNSLGPLLGAMGLKLLIAVDHETLEKFASQRPKRKVRRSYATNDMLPLGTKKRRAYPINSGALGKLLSHRATLLMSPNHRTRRAKTAAKVRWAKARAVRAASNQ